MTPENTAQPQIGTIDAKHAELQKQLSDRYTDEAVRKELYDDAVRHGTVSALLKGRCRFPHPRDAKAFADQQALMRSQISSAVNDD